VERKKGLDWLSAGKSFCAGRDGTKKAGIARLRARVRKDALPSLIVTTRPMA
jgi:hypothetical protein